MIPVILHMILFGVPAFFLLVFLYALTGPCESCHGPWAMQLKDSYEMRDEHLPEARGFDVYRCRWCGVEDHWRAY